MSEQDSSPIKTPQQLIWVIVLAFAVPVLAIVLLVQFVAREKRADPAAMTPEAISERLAPIGTVVLAGAAGPRTLQTGEAVYKLACSACHTPGVAGAPRTGDRAAWSARLAQGFDTLVKHAVEGFKTMPAKGGNADLDPIEVARAVAFMGNQVGANYKEPAAPAPQPAAAQAPASPAAARSGEAVVQAACANCHADGKDGAPKIGDRTAWSKRVALGVDAVTTAAIRGHDGMPARGGLAGITDAEMKAAVLYMFNRATAAAPAAPVAAVASAAAGSDAVGEKIYKQACTACHAAGVAGAPKTGDPAAWAARSALGVDALTTAVIKGKGVMPPRGGAANASDADLRAAVEYMLARVR
jgi:cytochrome c5